MTYRLKSIALGQGTLGVFLGVFLAGVTILAPQARAQSNESASGNGLAGAWKVQVTLLDCQTKTPQGPAISSLVSFHRGGTLSESVGKAAFEVGQRTDGHGIWQQKAGNLYSQRMVNLIKFDSEPNLPNLPGFDPTKPISPGFSAGTQIVWQEVYLTDGNHFTSVGGNEFYNSAGVLYRTGCSSAVGERIR